MDYGKAYKQRKKNQRKSPGSTYSHMVGTHRNPIKTQNLNLYNICQGPVKVLQNKTKEKKKQNEIPDSTL